MNIKITYNWLRDYLDTEADAYEIQKYLSLCGPSVERVDKVGDDYVMDIELTSNRVDAASVFGIAQEAQAILPRFGKKASIKHNPLNAYSPETIKKRGQDTLEVIISDPTLVPRFTAVTLSSISFKDSPSVIQQRLEACGIRSINVVVDITNYLMLSLGQPVHAFDYGKIKGTKMIVRQSRKGEEIVTLDDKKINLPGEDIVIEDGDGRLIDLCGIMGGKNSMITADTKKVLLFVQTYNKQKIRRTSMTTGQRTDAATYFEKGLDEERVMPTLVYGIELLQQYANGTVSSPVYDLYPTPYKARSISVSTKDIHRLIGVSIDGIECKTILENLGFVAELSSDTLNVTIPSWRKDDIVIKEDIVEEVARIYGYHNLPNTIQETTYVKQPKDIELLFTMQSKIKYFFKHLGLHESMNYSMISEHLLKSFNLDASKHLMLANTISEEIKYMRTSLIPSLAKNIAENTGKRETLKFFEIAKVYIPRADELPDEQYKMGIVSNTGLFDLKGIMESLLGEVHIGDYTFSSAKNAFLAEQSQAELWIENESIGTIGLIKPTIAHAMGLGADVAIGEFAFDKLIRHAQTLPVYKPPQPHAVIYLDHTFTMSADKPFETIKKQAYEKSNLLVAVESLGVFKNKYTLRFSFSASDRNLTAGEAKQELEKILS